jgi:hypothetical protein
MVVFALDEPYVDITSIMNHLIGSQFINAPTGSYTIATLPLNMQIWVYAWWDEEQAYASEPVCGDYFGSFGGNPVVLESGTPNVTGVDIALTDLCSCTCDVNGDGTITPQDALCVFQKYLGICPTSCGPCEAICGDINGDGSTTPGDALCIFQEYLGIGCEYCETGGECEPQACGTYTVDCNPNVPCICFKTAEGTGACIDDFWCDNPTCSSSADCGVGQVCAIDTCCGVPMCAPDICTNGGPNVVEGNETVMRASGN